MAEEIKQTLGFDASQAIEVLKQLDQLLATLESRLNSQATAFGNFNSSAATTVQQLQNLTQQANNAAAALNALNNTHVNAPNIPNATGASAATPNPAAFTNTAQAANQAANAVGGANAQTLKFVVSLETLSRVVFTQAIVRGMSQIRDAIHEAFDSNLAFVKSLSEIATIGVGADRNIGALAARTRELSDSFNVPLLQVTKGLYETISNNFSGAAESQQVLIGALKFGKAAVVDLQGSVNLLTGALNAYAKTSDETEIIAAQFFKTIEIGRVTGTELVNSLGPIAPVAREAGVALTELDAAFATITIGGVKASRAATGIQAAIQGLLKPSDDLKKKFHELGVTSGEELIAAEGFQGALLKIRGTTDGTASSLEKLLPNVRAVNAVLRLTSEDGAAKFKDAFAQIEGADKATLNKAFQIRIDTNAEKVERDLNKIKNFFTVEIGEKLVSAMQKLFDTIPGGLDTVLDGITALVPVAAAATAGLALVGGTLLAVQANASLAAAGVNALVLEFAGLATAGLAASAAGDFLGNRLISTLQNAQKEFERGQKERIDRVVSTNEKIFNDESQTNQKIVRDFNKVGNDIRKTYFDRVDAAREANKLILEDTDSILSRIVQAHAKQLSDIKNASQRATSDIVKSQERQNSLLGQLDDRRFAFQTKQFNDNIQFARDLQRAETLASKAKNDLLTSRTPQGEKQALDEFQRSMKAAEDAAAIADKTGNRVQRIQAEREIQRILEKQIEAEKEFQRLRDVDRQKADADAAAESARLNRLKDLREKILKDAEFFDKKGNGEPLTIDQINVKKQAVNDALAEFKKLALQGTKLDISDILNLDQFESRINQKISGTDLKKLSALPSALDSLAAEIQGSLDSKSFLVKVVPDKAALAGKPANEQLQEANRQFQEQLETIDAGNKKLLERQRLEEGVKSDTGDITGILDTQNNALNTFIRNAGTAGKEAVQLKQDTAALFNDIKAAAANPNLNQADTIALLQRVEALKTRAATTPGTSGLFGGTKADIEAATRAIGVLLGEADKVQKLKNLDIGPGTEGQQKLDDAKQKILELKDALADPALKTAFDQPAAAASTMAEKGTEFKTALAPTVSALEADAAAAGLLAQNLALAAESAQAIALANAGIGTAAFGGLQQAFNAGGKVNAAAYFDQGGVATRGTDTLPTILTPGEFVVNATAARKNFPLLQAINAGQNPLSRGQGGDTTNVGDITVNLNGTSHSDADARRIGNSLRREIRRRTLVLR